MAALAIGGGGGAAAPSKHTDFQVGAIKLIRLQNFMIHKTLEVRPSSRVNFLIGPNGAGKSCVVSAICLGLGGESKDMERGDLRDFIMKGASEAHIRIELQGPPGARDTVVTRHLDARSGGEKPRVKSLWTYNDKPLKDALGKEELLTQLSRLHIQMDNPCQFLAQERVGSFSQLTPVKLLSHTIKAVNTALVADYNDLREKFKVQGLGKSRLAAVAQELAELEGKCERMVAQLKNWNKYQAIETDIKLLGVAKLSAERDKAEADAKASRTEAAQEDGELDAKLKEMPAALAAAAAAQQRWQEAKSDANAAAGKVHVLEKALVQLFNKLTNAGDDVNKLETEMSNVEDDEAQKKKLRNRTVASLEHAKSNESVVRAEASRLSGKDAETMEAQVSKKHRELEDAEGVTAGVKARATALKKAADAAAVNLNKVRDQAAARVKGLSGAPNHNEKQLLVLFKKAKAEGKFKGEVEVFPILDVMVHEAGRALVGSIENALWSDWGKGVLYTNEADRSTIDALKREARCEGVSIANITPATRTTGLEKLMAASARCSKLKSALGVKDLAPATELVRVFPPLLQACLAEKNFLATKFVTADKNAALALFSALDGEHRESMKDCAVFFPEGSVKVFSSGMASRESAKIARFLHLSVDESAVQRASEDAAEKKREADAAVAAVAADAAKVKKLEAEVEGLEKSLSSWKSAKKQLAAATQRREACEAKLAQLDAEKKGASSDALLRSNMAALREAQVVALGCAVEWMEGAKALEAAVAASAGAGMVLAHENQVLEAKETATKAFEKMQKQKAEKKAALDARAKKLLGEAEAKDKAFTKAREQLSDEERLRLQTLMTVGGDPSNPQPLKSVEDVDTLLEEKKADKTLVVVDPRAKQTYDELREKIVKRREEQEKITSQASSTEQMFRAKVDSFRAQLNSMAEKLSKRFGRIMADLGFKGDVNLTVDRDDEANVEKWGLCVRVSLKESMNLKVLSDQLSGGERAMSTMLLLLAMQETTPMPFRIVDEINQGVSAFNERGLMNTLARLFDSQDERGNKVPGSLAFAPRQLWVVTPKLLPDLRHAPSMRTVVVFNGPRVAGHKHAFSHFVSFTKLAVGASTRPRMAADDVLDFAAAIELEDDDDEEVGAEDDVVEEELVEDEGEGEEEEEEEEGGGGGGGAAKRDRKRKAPGAGFSDEEEEEEEGGGGGAYRRRKL